MNLIELGKTGVFVSRLCIGTGTGGCGGWSFQNRLSFKEFTQIMMIGFENGINFWDTSDDYGTHEHIKNALKLITRDKIVLADKIHANSAEKARKDVLKCLEELSVEQIDIMLLHEIDIAKNYDNSRPALAELHKLKKEGFIRAVGVSTHSIDVLEKMVADPLVEVVLTNFNFAEIHMDAGLKDYSNALKTAYDNKKGVYVMKTLGEGKLKDKYREAVKYNLSMEFIHSVSVGITSLKEIRELIEFI